ncbi:MAG: DeoR/GlpR family DNA-binding transcription regulator [Actinomycetota bacterium]|jgi:DeoR/GlpR family transcriptional regulator of sugar metabolism|nr:MAG: DeoR family transcriptional regulator [Acidimicrobiaceae bacterium]
MTKAPTVDPGVEANHARAFARQRQEVIVAEVRRRGSVRVSELATLLGVSDMTVRRDLDFLDETGLVDKVHGGATLPDEHSADEPGFEAKSLRNMAEKHAIAMAGAARVRAGSAIGVTAGTTTWQFAYHLVDIADLTVVTNSVQVADVLHHHQRPDRTVVLTGGMRTPSDALVGPVAVATLSTLHLDSVFMGVHGISERAGFTTPNLMEADTNRAFIESTEHLVVLADHTKWSVTGLSSIAPLRRAQELITDRGLPQAGRTALGAEVGRLVITDPQFVDDSTPRPGPPESAVSAEMRPTAPRKRA